MLVIICLTTALSGCGNTNKTNLTEAEQKAGISKKTLDLYAGEDGDPYDFYFFKEQKLIPALYIDTLIDDVFEGKLPYKLKKGNNNSQYTIYNIYTNAEMKIDVKSGDVIYDNLTAFEYGYDDATENTNFLDEYGGVKEFMTCELVEEDTTCTKGHEYKINLKDYDIPFMEIDDRLLMPADVFLTLLNNNYGTFYYDGLKTVSYINSSIADLYNFTASKAHMDKDFYTYTYNYFCLIVDRHFGLAGYSRTMRNNNEEFNYLPSGALTAFAPYKEDLINSENIDSFDKTMTKMINEQLDDGGHTLPLGNSFGGDVESYPDSSKDVLYYSQLQNVIVEARSNSDDVDCFVPPIDPLVCYDSDNDEKYDIAYITYDEFLFESNEEAYGFYETLCGKEGINAIINPSTETYDSSLYDIKDVVIDISYNGGGDTVAEGLLLSWLTDGVAKQTLYGSKDGYYSTVAYRYDINEDGEYNQKDYLPKDINIYILISGCTYSAANALAYDLEVYTRNMPKGKNVIFVGSATGGGACSLTDNLYLPTGYSFRLASNSVSIDPLDPTICSENGVQPTETWECDATQLATRTGENGLNKAFLDARSE